MLHILRQIPTASPFSVVSAILLARHSSVIQDRLLPRVVNQAMYLEPARFTEEDTELLLSQLLSDRPDHVLDWNTRDLAASVMGCTAGHRGLTGVSLGLVDGMIKDKIAISEVSWAKIEGQLPFLLGSGGIGTYHALVSDLVAVQEDDGVQAIMEAMLHNAGQGLSCVILPILLSRIYKALAGRARLILVRTAKFTISAYACAGQYLLRPDEARLPSGEYAWQRLVWSGIAVGPDQDQVIRISSPLLLRALIIAVTDSGGLPQLPPFPSEQSSR